MRLKPIHWLYLALALGGFLYAAVVRPWQNRWGATDDELQRTLPGDELAPSPSYATKRAITIDAPSEGIWPWLVQLGQGRGGFYSYDSLENLIGLDIQSVDEIVPEYQDLKVGDFVAAAPDEAAGWLVSALDPPRTMVLHVGTPSTGPNQRGNFFQGGVSGVWSFVLEPIDDKSTRLIVSFRAGWEPSIGASLFTALILEPGHFIMERGMLLGIKRRAEGHSLKDQTSSIAA